MKGQYDEINEIEVLAALDRAGLKYRNGSRYILSQCPLHDDTTPSVQIYKNDWFVNCHAGCGRFHITKPYPELRTGGEAIRNARPKQKEVKINKVYKQYNMFDEWERLQPIPRNHSFKTIPLDVLDNLGWRYDESKNSYFIPYWNMDQTQVPLAQYRHLSGERRFSFIANARAIAYGLWNLVDGERLFLVEGTSDCAVLEYCGIPWIGMPSANSKPLIEGLAKYAKEHNISIVYAGDNDKAGEQMREALDEVMSYEVCQPPFEYKDWGDFLVATNRQTVIDWCHQAFRFVSYDEVVEVSPGAIELTIKGAAPSKAMQPPRLL